uniref:RNA-directed RNA polymerase catalytic subunit n=1 Tax=Tongren Ortho tick virus 1 TaxID=2972257 RepID=A0A9E7V244_9ORTO|nr:MAG: polymerase basic 1 protein [Tongren Ortho tick virus 1]
MANSFFRATLIKKNNAELQRIAGPHPREVASAGLRNIAHLYQYVNVPPLAVGVTAHKVTESVLRSIEYNRLPQNGLGDRPTQAWPGGKPYPFDQITSNFSPSACRAMFIDFLKENHMEIDQALQETWNYISTVNSDILTTGRQTWDPIHQRSVPSAQAYKEITDLFDRNQEDRTPTLLGFIQSFHNELGLNTVLMKRREFFTEESNKRDRDTGLITRVSTQRVRVVEKVLEGEEAYQDTMERATSFCAYLKSKERGKLERRAIASANMVLRAHLFIVEKFHLLLSKPLEGSIIGCGGDEKKNKILLSLDSVKSFPGEEAVVLQATEDVTKFNECLAPECFALFHDILLDPTIREENNLPELGPEMAYLRKIFRHTFFLLAKKRIWLGKGHTVSNDKNATHMLWEEGCVHMMNSVTKEWFLKAKDSIQNGYLTAPYGMLMGMLNAASTTMALSAVRWRLTENMDCKTARSSDDSMTAFSAASTGDLEANIRRLYDNLRLMGINISEKKTRFFRFKFGELTSWYMDGDFTAQYGVETSSLRPVGTNPADDFHAVASQAVTSLRSGTTNLFGAQARLCIGVNNCRRLWKIERSGGKRPNVSAKVQVLSDGGDSPWNWSNSHLPEISLKKRLAVNQEEKDYLLRVMNPNNPFTTMPHEVTTYSVELGQLVEAPCEIPRNLFTSMKRSNATKRSLLRAAEDDFRKTCSLVTEIFETIDPLSALLTPKTTQNMSTTLLQVLQCEEGALRSVGVDFSAEEEAEIAKAIDILRGVEMDIE